MDGCHFHCNYYALGELSSLERGNGSVLEPVGNVGSSSNGINQFAQQRGLFQSLGVGTSDEHVHNVEGNEIGNSQLEMRGRRKGEC